MSHTQSEWNDHLIFIWDYINQRTFRIYHFISQFKLIPSWLLYTTFMSWDIYVFYMRHFCVFLFLCFDVDIYVIFMTFMRRCLCVLFMSLYVVFVIFVLHFFVFDDIYVGRHLCRDIQFRILRSAKEFEIVFRRAKFSLISWA